MKKLLIYFPREKLIPKGGPAGYLFNLQEGLKNINCNDIKIDFIENYKSKIEDNSELRKRVPKFLRDIRRTIKYLNYLNKKAEKNEEFKNYECIHFHSTEDMYFNRDNLKDFKGKVILTSHTPLAPYKQIIDTLNPLHYKIFKEKIDKLQLIDEYAFKRADFIIFPCKEAMEPYYNTWDGFENIIDENKVRYMLTGVKECSVKVNREEIRKKYNIPEDAFLISYVGRHNSIKGYDFLKNVGEKILSDSDIYFIIAGKEEPLKGLSNSKWIEIGWTSDPYSIVKASNLFILPNKETYFDLVLLEVMSIGVPVFISNTGGNRYFNQYNSNGIKIFDDEIDLIKQIKNLKNTNFSEREKMGAENLKIFKKDFTCEVFANNYLNTIRSII